MGSRCGGATKHPEYKKSTGLALPVPSVVPADQFVPKMSTFIFLLLMPCMALAANETLDACDETDVHCSCDDRLVGEDRRISYSCSIPDLDDEQVDWILDTIPDNATSFTCTYCHLRHVPVQIHQLTRLKRLSLNGNRGIRVLTNESLPAFEAFDYIGLSLMELESIEADAFRGNFSSTELNLLGNDLTRLDASVFLHVLESMKSGSGFVQLSENQILCDCNLTWLIRDHRHLLPSISGGHCPDGTPFLSLNPADFDDCPIPTEPPSSAMTICSNAPVWSVASVILLLFVSQ